MIAEPGVWLLVGFVAHKLEVSWIYLGCSVLTLILVSKSMEWRKQNLISQAREREMAEQEAILRGVARDAKTLRLTEREKVLLEELDCRNWLDDIVNKIYLKYRDDLSLGLKNILDGVLGSLCPLGPIDSLVFSKFDLGKHAPSIVKVVAVRMSSASEAMLDLELCHVGAVVDVELLARLGRTIGVTIPLSLSSISLEAIARVKVTMCHRTPYIGVLDIAFAAPPKTLDFNLKALVELTGLPSVVPLISNAVKNILNDLMVWPKRISLPLDEWFHPTSVPPAVARGILSVTIDRGADLPAADIDGSSDPYLTLEVLGDDGMSGFLVRDTAKTSIKSKTLFPLWRETFAFHILDTNKDKLQLSVFDYDTVGAHDLLGTAEIPSDILKELADSALGAPGQHRTRRFWIRLSPPSKDKAKSRFRLGSAKVSSNPPPRIRLELSYGVLMPQRFPPLDEVAEEAFLATEQFEGTEETKQDDTSPPLATMNNLDQEEKAENIEQEAKEDMKDDTLLELDEENTSDQVREMDIELLRRLYRRGQVCLKAGFVKKEGFSGLRQWRKRWLELELMLEYEFGAADPAVAASLKYFKASDDRGDDLDERDANDKAKPVGDVRLLPTDELGNVYESGFEMHTGAKLWRIRKHSSDDTDVKVWIKEWTDSIKRALRCIQMSRSVLANHVRAAAASGSPEPAVRESGGATVVVEIVEARGLIAADKSGLADPFVIAKLGGQVWQSRTLRQTLEPKWFEYTEFWAGHNDSHEWTISNSKRLATNPRQNDTLPSLGTGSVQAPAKNASAAFGGFSLSDGVLELQVMDEDLRGKSELLGSLLVPIVDLLPVVGANSEHDKDFSFESHEDALHQAFSEPPKPQWFQLHPPDAPHHGRRRISMRRHHHKKNITGAGNFDDSLGAGEILLRLTLRKFEVAKLSPLRRLSHSVQVMRAVQNFAYAAHHRTAAGVNAAVKGTSSGVNVAVKGTTTAAKAAVNLAAKKGRPLSFSAAARQQANNAAHAEANEAATPATSQ